MVMRCRASRLCGGVSGILEMLGVRRGRLCWSMLVHSFFYGRRMGDVGWSLFRLCRMLDK